MLAEPGEGSKSRKLSDVLHHEIIPSLTPEAVYSHPDHQWKQIQPQKLRGGCPFHKSKSRTSFVVDRQDLSWYCHGCGFGGGPLEYLARLRGRTGSVRGTDFVELVQELASIAGVSLPERGARTPEDIQRSQEELQRQVHIDAVQQVCEEVLWSDAGADARAYLTEQRGLSEEHIREFRLGLFPEVSVLRDRLRERSYDLNLAARHGLLEEYWPGYVTLIWRDERGRPSALFGRFAGELPDDDDRPKSLYTKGRGRLDSPLFFDRWRFSDAKDVVAVEGPFDAIQATILGVERCVAYGGGSLTRKQAATLAKLRIERVVLSPDPDSGGEKGVLTSLASAQSAALEAAVAELPPGLDPDKLMRERGVECWRSLLESVTPGGLYRAKALAEEHRTRTAAQNLQAVSPAMSYLREAMSLDVLVEGASVLVDELIDWLCEAQDSEKRLAELLRHDGFGVALAILRRDRSSEFEGMLADLKRRTGFSQRKLDSIRRAIPKDLPTDFDPASQEREQPAGQLLDPGLGAPGPRGLLVPPGYKVSGKGVHRVTDEGHVQIATEPIALIARFRDFDEETEWVRVAWRRGSTWQEIVTSRFDIASKNEIVKLSNRGLPVTTSNAGRIVDYLAAFEHENFDLLPVTRLTSRFGWQHLGGQPVFLAGRQLVTAEKIVEIPAALPQGSRQSPPIHLQLPDAGEEQLARAFHPQGSLEAWKELIRLLGEFPQALAPVLGSLAAPLLHVLKLPNFLISISGRTSKGKTTVLKLGMSVWGNPSDCSPDSLFRTWQTTPAAIGRMGSLCRSLPVHLDETSLAKSNPNLIAETIYAVASGREKSRGSLRGMQASGSWRTVLITTGEQPLASFTAGDGGTHARVLELAGSPFGEEDQSELVARLTQGAEENFGHAGPAFVQYLLRNGDQWERWRDEYEQLVEVYRRDADSNVGRRLARWMAAMAMAGRLASSSHSAVLPLEAEDITDALDNMWHVALENSKGADRDRQALLDLVSYVNRTPTRFRGRSTVSDHSPPQGWAGVVERDRKGHLAYLAFFQDWVRPHLEKLDYSPEAILRAWRDRGWLRCDEENRLTSSVRLGGTGKSRLYVIDVDRIEDLVRDAEDEDEDDPEEPGTSGPVPGVPGGPDSTGDSSSSRNACADGT